MRIGGESRIGQNTTMIIIILVVLLVLCLPRSSFPASATLEREWTGPVPVPMGAPNGQDYVRCPSIAVDGNGNAVAVWQQGLSELSTLANRFTKGSGWGNPVVLDDAAATSWPDVACDQFGNAIAVWEHRDSLDIGTPTVVQASRYWDGWGWGPSSTISQGNGNASEPRIAVDAMGNAIVIWRFSIGFNSSIWSNRYMVGAGWMDPQKASTGGGNWGGHEVAVDMTGDAIAVWTGGAGIMANRYSNSSWGIPVVIGNGIYPKIAGNAAGDAVAAWAGVLNGTGGLISCRFSPDVGWGAAVAIGEYAQLLPYEEGPSVAMSSSGEAVIAWDQWVGEGPPASQAVVSRSFVDTAWSIPEPVGTPVEYWPSCPVVAIDSLGNAIVVWPNINNSTLWGRSYTVGQGWGTPVLVSGDRNCSLAPIIAMDAMGNAMVLWLESEGNSSIIWTCSYAGVEPQPDMIVIEPDLSDISRDISMLRWAVVANSALAFALASVLILVLLRRRNGSRGSPIGLHGDSRSRGPDSTSGQVMHLQLPADNNSTPANGLNQERRWPSRAISGPLRLTAKERILLHLLHFARYADSLEVPPELTQERIAEAAGIERRHFTQYVHPLEEDELVRERTSRVRGVVQKRRVYVLTEEGVRRTLGVRDRVRSAMVRVRDASAVREVTVAEALIEARGSMSVLDIIRESIETGIVDLTRSASSGREAGPMTVGSEEGVLQLEENR